MMGDAVERAGVKGVRTWDGEVAEEPELGEKKLWISVKESKTKLSKEGAGAAATGSWSRVTKSFQNSSKSWG
jgi:hypothetical protein